MINKKKICWQNYKPVAGCQQLTMKQITWTLTSKVTKITRLINQVLLCRSVKKGNHTWALLLATRSGLLLEIPFISSCSLVMLLLNMAKVSMILDLSFWTLFFSSLDIRSCKNTRKLHQSCPKIPRQPQGHSRVQWMSTMFNSIFFFVWYKDMS